ncbi:MAG: 2-dehydropantoate 2-reductase [Betaproteobacteria bacterium]
MKIGIAGAGSIGCYLGSRLALSGQAEVSALARGETLAALRQHGFRLQTKEGSFTAPVTASDDASELGVQDLLIIAVKGPALPALAPALGPLIGPQTIILPTMNGVPWWFCLVDGPLGKVAPFALKSVDPHGTITDNIPLQQTFGCVVHVGASCPEPGVVRHAMGQELIIGEACGGTSERTDALARLLSQAGLEIKPSTNIRYDIWYKLWGNLTMNPVSAITGATIDRLLGDPLVSDFCSAAMREAALVGERIGCHVTQQPEDRHAITYKLGAFKTSMLQDVEAGRAIELDSIVGAAHEIGRHLGLQTPYIDAILGLTRLFARTRGLYPEAAKQ